MDWDRGERLIMEQDLDSDQFQHSLKSGIESAKELSPQAWDELFRYYSSLTNNDNTLRSKKSLGLLLLGLEEGIVEEMCREKEVDIDEVMRSISKKIVKDRRAWKREQRQKLKVG